MMLPTSPAGGLSARLSACLDALPRYRVERTLPAHVGVSVEAHDTRLNRRVLLRIYGPENNPDRALAGAQAASQVRHPAVVSVHDAGILGEDGDRSVYVAVEHLAPSRSLRAWLSNAPARVEVSETFDTLAQGLHAAHEAGVVHGGLDGTAARVRSDGRAVLIEFRGSGVTRADDLRALARLWLRATARWRNARREAVLRRAVDPRQRDPFASVEAFRRAMFDAGRSRAGAVAVGLAVSGAVAGVGGWWWAAAEPPPTPCPQRVASEAVAVWSPRRAEAVRAGLSAATGPQAAETADRLLPRIDAYMERWREGADALCVAEAQPPRAACYAEALSELDSLLSLFEVSDPEGVAVAPSAVTRLPDLGACDRQRGTGDPQATDLSREFGRLLALERIGADDESYKAATELLASTPGLTDSQRARLHRFRAVALFEQRAFESAVDEAKDTYAIARKAGAIREQVQAASLLVSIEGNERRNQAQASAWLERAREAAETPGADPLLVAIVDKAEANYAYGVGDYIRALELIERCIATRSRVQGPEHPMTWSSRNNRAAILRTLGRGDEANTEVRMLLEHQVQTYGTMNATVARSYNNLGSGLSELGRYKESVEALERAVEIWRATKGPRYADLGMAFTNLGRTYAQLGQYELALESLHSAIDVWTDAFGPDDYRLGIARNNLSATYTIMDRHGDAAEQGEEAYRIQVARNGPDHPDNVYPTTNLAHSYAKLGRFADARRWADEGVRIVRGREGELPIEFYKAVSMSAEVHLEEARATPEDAELVAQALSGMREACALSVSMEDGIDPAHCYTVLAEALLDFGADDAAAVATRAISLIDASETTRQGYADARKRLEARVRPPQ
ncbi:MAG: tetratricopeptide repeat protein [Nannocystales bacterium]